MGVFIIAEIGINHNGDLDIAKKLIGQAKKAGCDAVKFQKRTLDKVYSAEELDRPRKSPWGETNRQQKEGLEFSIDEYKIIDEYCKELGIEWFASSWDIDSQKELRVFNCKYNKVASAMLGNEEFLNEVAQEKKMTYISTGMSSLEEIDWVVEIFKKNGCPYELMHCNSTYPMQNSDANLGVMATLKERFGVDIGYSGHETGRIVSLIACALGATSLERHITLDRAMYGSDQAASIEVGELGKLVADVRAIDSIIGSTEKVIQETEVPIREKLRYYEGASL